MLRRIVILTYIVVYCLVFVLPVRPVKAEQQKYTAEIRPEMELLAGVLAQTDWMNIKGPAGKGNAYFRELKDFLAPYQGHDAVTIASQLIARGFTYDAPTWKESLQ